MRYQSGANACLPGYGAFMATQYLGFRDSAPDTAGIALGASSIAAQLLLPSLMTVSPFIFSLGEGQR